MSIELGISRFFSACLFVYLWHHTGASWWVFGGAIILSSAIGAGVGVARALRK